MTRTMYDGINSDAAAIAALPVPIGLVAGYDDGFYAWSAADWARFPNSVHVHIAVHPGTDSGSVLDVEKDDATPAQAVDWVLMRRAAGADPTVYCNQHDPDTGWPAVRAAFQARGVPEPHYWVAAYVSDPGRVPPIPAGAVALQYYDFGQYDASVVADHWPGVDDPAVPDTGTTSTQEDDMATYYPIQVLPDPAGSPNACGVATWPQGAVHVIQLIADPGLWGARSGHFRLAFNLTSGPDVESEVLASPGEKIAVELVTVPGLNPAACSGVTITRPDGAKWPWGGGAV